MIKLAGKLAKNYNIKFPEIFSKVTQNKLKIFKYTD